MSDIVPSKDPETGRFLTGNIGGGRPKGARNKLSEAFVQALADSFDEHGAETIETVRTEKPDQYLKVIASLVPKDHTLTINNADDLSDAELAERVRALAAQLAPFLTGGTGDAEPTGADAGGPQLAARVH